VKIDDRIIDATGELIELQSELTKVESAVGKDWCPLKIIKAKESIANKKDDIKELEGLLDEVKATIKEYIG